jgi:hypothetical protein
MKKTLTKEEKELLIKDLLLRTQTDVLVKVPGENEPKELRKRVRWMITFGRAKSVEDCLTGLIPYLRPYSDMTPEEVEELDKIGWRVDELADNEPWAHNGSIWSILDGLQYLITHHFDIYGLLEKDLAIKAEKEMYEKQ